MNSSVAIIVLNWNSFEVTNDCLHSLAGLTHPSYKVILVDNASADGSADELAAAHPQVICLRSSTNLGFTGGNNIGLRYALQNGFTYSLILNNDTLAEPDFLAKLTAYMDAHREAGAVQPRIFYQHNRQLLWNGGSYYNRFLGWSYTLGEAKHTHPKYAIRKEVDWITGCAFLVRNSVLQQSGLFADKFFLYNEDVDLSFRIRKLGYPLVYEPDAVIYHIAGMSTKSKTKSKEGYVHPLAHYYNQRNRLWIIKQYTPWYCVPSVALFNFGYLVMVLGYFTMRGRFQKLKAMTRAIKDGIFDSIQYP